MQSLNQFAGDLRQTPKNCQLPSSFLMLKLDFLWIFIVDWPEFIMKNTKTSFRWSSGGCGGGSRFLQMNFLLQFILGILQKFWYSYKIYLSRFDGWLFDCRAMFKFTNFPISSAKQSIINILNDSNTVIDADAI